MLGLAQLSGFASIRGKSGRKREKEQSALMSFRKGLTRKRVGRKKQKRTALSNRTRSESLPLLTELCAKMQKQVLFSRGKKGQKKRFKKETF